MYAWWSVSVRSPSFSSSETSRSASSDPSPASSWCTADRIAKPTVRAMPSCCALLPLATQRSTTPSSATSNANVPSASPLVSYNGAAPASPETTTASGRAATSLMSSKLPDTAASFLTSSKKHSRSPGSSRITSAREAASRSAARSGRRRFIARVFPCAGGARRRRAAGAACPWVLSCGRRCRARAGRSTTASHALHARILRTQPLPPPRRCTSTTLASCM
mmetsp:Transcript_18284/g.54087  ORF Transcript_18284/g.54087 Transcript_18284/m.54087 type:complete len:221 (+) Transcript_18284:201-863(+)